MYNRRKLDRDVRRYTRDNSPIRSSELEKIGRRHGFHIGGTPFRKDSVSLKDA